MIGTLLTIGAGVYTGLYLASKGCTYKAAMRPLKEASDMIRTRCGCKTPEPEQSCDYQNVEKSDECCNKEEQK